MSAFVVGGLYRTRWGSDVRCSSRFFGGALGECEFVEMTTVQPAAVGEIEAVSPHRCMRTAHVWATSVVPPITDALGGALRSDMCDHISVRGGPAKRVVANAGPNAGRPCCVLCGGYVGRLRVWMPNHCRPAEPRYSDHPTCATPETP